MGSPFRHSPLARFQKSFWRFFAFSFQTPSDPRLSTIRNPKGSAAIIMAFIFMVMASLLVVAGSQLVKILNQQSRQQELYFNEAKNAALAGLKDGQGWFTRQASQPVSSAIGFGSEPNPAPTFVPGLSYVDQAFSPKYSAADPVTGDTLDINNNMIEIEFSPQGAGSVSEGTSNQTIWDRYEVHKQANPFPTPSTLPTYTPDPMAVHDISGERVNGTWNGSGLVWSIVSTGYVYQRKDFRKNASGTDWTVPYNQYPNKVLAKAVMGTEIRKLTVQNPFVVTGAQVEAAVYLDRAAGMTVGQTTDTVVDGSKGSAYGCAAVSTASCPSPKGVNSTNFPQTVYCAPTSAANQLTDLDVFGMPVSQLGAIADIEGNNGANPQTLVFGTGPQLAYYNGDLTIDPASPVSAYQFLNAQGVLAVNGNLTINSAGITQQTYFGVIFVTKNFTLNGGYIDGEVIMGYTGPAAVTAGNVTILRSSDGLVPGTVIYDHDLITASSVRSIIPKIAQYREDVSERRLLVPIPNL